MSDHEITENANKENQNLKLKIQLLEEQLELEKKRNECSVHENENKLEQQRRHESDDGGPHSEKNHAPVRKPRDNRRDSYERRKEKVPDYRRKHSRSSSRKRNWDDFSSDSSGDWTAHQSRRAKGKYSRDDESGSVRNYQRKLEDVNRQLEGCKSCHNLMKEKRRSQIRKNLLIHEIWELEDKL